MKKGKLITLEGGEGAGKSTQAKLLCEWLEAQGIQAERTREPGGTPVAEAIRLILLEQHEESIPAAAELLLMFAARSAHVENRIKPALVSGRWVVCDRFVDASYAYQGAGRGLPIEAIQNLEQLVLGPLLPNLVLLLDLPAEVGLQRTTGRDVQDRFEQEELAFFAKVRQGYLERAKAQPRRMQIIDAAQSEADVQKQIQEVVQQQLLTTEQHGE